MEILHNKVSIKIIKYVNTIQIENYVDNNIMDNQNIISLMSNNSQNNKTHKYFIHCDDSIIKSIKVEELVKNTDGIQVVKAIIENPEFHNKKIVVKMGQDNVLIEKEYSVSNILFDNGITGFVNFMCIFSCYDNTSESINSRKICTSTPQTGYHKKVIIMPYFEEQSILQRNWSESNAPLLKGLIIQTIMILFNAFDKIGFIHGDLHFGNVMVKTTTKQSVRFELFGHTFEQDTYGYEPVLIDFDNSIIHKNKEKYYSMFWMNMSSLISRMMYEFTNKNSETRVIVDVSGPSHMLSMYAHTSTPVNLQSFLSIYQWCVISMQFMFSSNHSAKSYTYDPNVYGGKKTRKQRKNQ